MNLLHAKLAIREREVMQGVCAGLTNPQIAEVMRISDSYVALISHRLLPKVGATSVRHAAYLFGCGEVKDASLVDIKLIAQMIADAAVRRVGYSLGSDRKGMPKALR